MNRRIILNTLSIIGIVATPILAISGTIKAIDKVKNIENISTRELIKSALPCYVPTITVMLATGVCVVLNDRMNRRDYLTLSTLYGITNKTLQEYRAKVIELDENTVDVYECVEEIKQKDNHKSEQYMMYDIKSDRYFDIEMNRLLDAVDRIYLKLEHHDFVSLNQFYELLGLPPTSLGENVGWYTNDDQLLVYLTVSYNDRECILIDVNVYAKNTY